ncbi:helix-turn-helix transcriptional regulator [Cellulomonas dongxiuzhuiae]|uniref:WYL domain-containing protein n=1 Tax=Cellulomonas dongxiuzhuiae TaxID=2819979 RepID=A0ABX8GL10_9CELL|nr:WYL domain-containing protein [Cellulomonas dongxiuzhuiae]MBO3095364.1 WYL domain-containing protein [Cellulomonas dongxiuzhuiae]QWC16351.1 WYL domain-containing protein [Cellulomonas dongxiuzhuiae]
MTSGTTTTRLLRLLSLLQTPRDWPGPALADRLGVSERTVRRDVDRLRTMGYRVHADRGSAGGYRLEAGAELPPLLLDDDQVTAIAVALQAVPLLGTDVDEAAQRALGTIRRVMPPRLRRRAQALQFETAAVASSAPVAATDVLVAVSAAVRAREVLRFDYAGGTGLAASDGGPPRRAEPHHLVAALGRWYVVAWDLDRADWRVFRVDRMAPRTPNGPRFTPRDLPGGDVRQLLSARFRGATTADGWPCRGTVVLDLPARDVLPFAGDGVVEDLGDGRCRLTAGSWSWVALAASLGRFDADVRVEDPDELREACARLAGRYEDAGRRGPRDPGARPGTA